MTSAVENATSETSGDVPDHDIDRHGRCPLDPAPAMRAQQAEVPLTQIRLWDGSSAWLVTGCDARRAALSDLRVGVDPMRPGAPKLPVDEVDEGVELLERKEGVRTVIV